MKSEKEKGGHTPIWQRLDELEFGEIKDWLYHALHDKEPLPKGTVDEPPHVTIRRVDRKLQRSTREDLRDACEALVREFTQNLTADNEFLNGLLSLSWRFNLSPVADLLHELAVDEERFWKLESNHQQQVLLRLVDFKVDLPAEYWRKLVQRDERTFGTAAFQGLLRHGAKPALQILPELPDSKPVANVVAGVLTRYRAKLEFTDRDHVVCEVKRIRPQLDSGSSLSRVLDKWLEKFDVGDLPEGGGPALDLEEVLAELEKKYPENAQPSWRGSARLPTAA